ncbi:odorant receptor 10-like [Rhynchophorus ferrugineus]|uniref:odorant receptor 10-like n=1 Tax=Rhynchophorus ferrugineus TaxID=354439 RepID=UPI003FCD57EA
MLMQVCYQLLLFGYCADEIQSLSGELSTTIYCTNWYKQSTAIKKLFFLAMMRSKNPIVLTIGPFGVMSEQSVIAIFKMAYSYVSLLSRGK